MRKVFCYEQAECDDTTWAIWGLVNGEWAVYETHNLGAIYKHEITWRGGQWDIKWVCDECYHQVCVNPSCWATTLTDDTLCEGCEAIADLDREQYEYEDKEPHDYERSHY